VGGDNCGGWGQVWCGECWVWWWELCGWGYCCTGWSGACSARCVDHTRSDDELGVRPVGAQDEWLGLVVVVVLFVLQPHDCDGKGAGGAGGG